MVLGIILVILVIINFFFLLSLKFKANRIIDKKKEKLEEERKQEFINIEEQFKVDVENLRKEVENKKKFYDEIIQQNERIIRREEQQKEALLNEKKEAIDEKLNHYQEQRTQELQRLYESKEEELKKNFEQKVLEFQDEEEQLRTSLEEYRSKRAAVNEAILREKEIQEKEHFYKLDISEDDIKDIEVLKTIEPRLRNKEALNKLIYDVFISRPAQEMIKRVLGGKSPSGIYKITYIKTGEAYIGRAVSVRERWVQHIKSAYGLGTIAHSSLHIKMAQKGVWNFTFELLEEVDKEKLGEREKYWIDFYDTKNMGLNQKAGG